MRSKNKQKTTGVMVPGRMPAIGCAMVARRFDATFHAMILFDGAVNMTAPLVLGCCVYVALLVKIRKQQKKTRAMQASSTKQTKVTATGTSAAGVSNGMRSMGSRCSTLQVVALFRAATNRGVSSRGQGAGPLDFQYFRNFLKS